MTISPKNTVITPRQPSHTPESSSVKDITTVIDEIDELMKKQTTSENKRQDASATTAAAHREIDLAQDLLHTSLQRIANVDDDIFHTRSVLATKEETLNKVITKKKSVFEERQIVESEAAELQKILNQQASLVADLQRKLLQGGISPEEILKIQKDAREKARNIVATVIPTESARSKEEKKQKDQQKPSRRRMRFPLFGKASS